MKLQLIHEVCAQRKLQPHPEGGFFRETLVDRDPGAARSRCTRIEFLLPHGQFSAMHRLDSPEVWEFRQGGSLRITEIDPAGVPRHIHLGPDAAAGQVLQHRVPQGVWFGARVLDPGTYARVDCTMKPGFEWDGFELGARQDLCEKYPHAIDAICDLTAQTEQVLNKATLA